MVPEASVAVVTLSFACTVSETVVEAVFEAESVAVTTMLNVPAAVGVPETAPPVDRLRPAGSVEPLAAAQVQV
jgi:hypothetical protein